MYFKNTLFSFLKLVFLCWITKRTARVKEQVIFCFGLFVMFWCAARAYIFRDRVISERIWVWLGDPVSAFPHSRLRWARALAWQPDPRHPSSFGGARNTWAERASWRSPGIFSHLMVYFQGASSERRPDLELSFTD